MRNLLRTMLPISVLLLAVFAVAAASEAATLKVSSFPSGAQVSIDGVSTGKVTPMNVSLLEGDHLVTVQIPGSGWNPDTRTVTIVTGNNDLSVTLLPTPTPGPPGPKGDKGDQGPTGPAGPPAARAAGPCFDNTNRYVDCGNGTVTDTVTGLIWLKQADCLVNNAWAAANVSAAALANGACGLTDGSSAGDWRLPTKDEWSATIAHARTYAFDAAGFPLVPKALGCTFFGPGSTYPNGTADSTHLPPSLTNDAGTGCQAAGPSSFAGVAVDSYWSSSTNEGNPDSGAWGASLGVGINLVVGKGNTLRVWPVRGGK